MAKTKRKWLELDFTKDGCIRAQDIPYDASQSIKTKIDSIVQNYSSLACLSARRTSTYTPSTTFANLTFDTLDLNNQNSVIAQDSVDLSKFYIKQSGYYQLAYDMTATTSVGTREDIQAQIIVNGSSIIPQSYSDANIYTSEIHDVDKSIPFYLNANDYIQVQVRKASTGTVIVQSQAILTILKLDGIRGEQGPAGEGALIIQKEGSQVASGINILNFKGSISTIAEGNNTVSLQVSADNQTKVIQCWSTATINASVTTPVVMTWDQEDVKDSIYSHDTTNNSRIYVNAVGLYRLSYKINLLNSTNTRSTIKTQIRLDGSNYLPRTIAYSSSYNATDAEQTNSCEVLLRLSAGQYLELLMSRVGSSATNCSTLPNESHILLELVRAS